MIVAVDAVVAVPMNPEPKATVAVGLVTRTPARISSAELPLPLVPHPDPVHVPLIVMFVTVMLEMVPVEATMEGVVDACRSYSEINDLNPGP